MLVLFRTIIVFIKKLQRFPLPSTMNNKSISASPPILASNTIGVVNYSALAISHDQTQYINYRELHYKLGHIVPITEGDYNVSSRRRQRQMYRL